MKNRQCHKKKCLVVDVFAGGKDRTVNCFVSRQGGKEYKARRESRITEPSVCLPPIYPRSSVLPTIFL
jgi:hypothetical protein